MLEGPHQEAQKLSLAGILTELVCLSIGILGLHVQETLAVKSILAVASIKAMVIKEIIIVYSFLLNNSGCHSAEEGIGQALQLGIGRSLPVIAFAEVEEQFQGRIFEQLFLTGMLLFQGLNAVIRPHQNAPVLA